jgi:hypothetical protein
VSECVSACDRPVPRKARLAQSTLGVCLCLRCGAQVIIGDSKGHVMVYELKKLSAEAAKRTMLVDTCDKPLHA